MKIIERKLQSIGESLLLSLPKPWTKLFHLKKGSVVQLLVGEQGTLTLAPTITEHKEKKNSTIIYDQHFIRRFYHDYFEGNETITIQFKEPPAKKAYEELQTFLNNFMNAQIIAEEKDKLIIKCFTINELGIEECLERMYHLSQSMLEALLQGNTEKLNDMDKTITKFYYLLVMQIRRYLSEGTYTQQTLTLLRAMDCRMAAEKIERIADNIKNVGILPKELLQHYITFQHYYHEAFQTFIHQRYEQGMPLLQEAYTMKKTYQKLIEQQKNLTPYQQLITLQQCLTYAKEISLFVR
ncbi:MAG: phosphate uptake regulator PhoU [Nanoarchaeota archaeon]|nr:phosphate uptake regulator PhoU [Nanoarchaeota archaeon]